MASRSRRAGAAAHGCRCASISRAEPASNVRPGLHMNANVLAHPCVVSLHMSLGPRPAASVADLAAIELRRIAEVLQVEHVSLFLHDSEHPQRAAEAAPT